MVGSAAFLGASGLHRLDVRRRDNSWQRSVLGDDRWWVVGSDALAAGISLIAVPAGRQRWRVDGDAHAARISLVPLSAGRWSWRVNSDARAARISLLPLPAGRRRWRRDSDARAARISLVAPPGRTAEPAGRWRRTRRAHSSDTPPGRVQVVRF
jgi:hypothetical protein